MIFKILILISFFYVILYKTKRSLHMLQQNLYNENNRYLKWVFQNFTCFFDFDLLVVCLSIIGYCVIYDVSLLSNIFMILIVIVNIFLIIKLRNKMKKDQNKKPLVYTKRVKRLIFTTSILYLIPFLFYITCGDQRIDWILLLIISFLSWINYFVVFIYDILRI